MTSHAFDEAHAIFDAYLERFSEPTTVKSLKFLQALSRDSVTRRTRAMAFTNLASSSKSKRAVASPTPVRTKVFGLSAVSPGETLST